MTQYPTVLFVLVAIGAGTSTIGMIAALVVLFR